MEGLRPSFSLISGSGPLERISAHFTPVTEPQNLGSESGMYAVERPHTVRLLWSLTKTLSSFSLKTVDRPAKGRLIGDLVQGVDKVNHGYLLGRAFLDLVWMDLSGTLASLLRTHLTICENAWADVSHGSSDRFGIRPSSIVDGTGQRDTLLCIYARRWFVLGLHMGDLDQFSTRTNYQTEPINFLINRSNPIDGEGVRFSSVQFGLLNCFFF